MTNVVQGDPWKEGSRATLDELAREGARRMIAAALEVEVDDYVPRFADERDADSHAKVVRNGRGKERSVTMGAGTVRLKAPRVNDKRVVDDVRQRFTRKNAPTLAECNMAMDTFIETYGAKYPKATKSLAGAREKLITHFDFPAEHWLHLRSTNPIESTFATVKLRQRVTKGAGSRAAGLAMAFKLLLAAERTWLRLNGPELMPLVRAGVCFQDGVRVDRDDANASSVRRPIATTTRKSKKTNQEKRAGKRAA